MKKITDEAMILLAREIYVQVLASTNHYDDGSGGPVLHDGGDDQQRVATQCLGAAEDFFLAVQAWKNDR